MKVYLVGGAVRNKSMGHEPKDHDYVIVGATNEDIQQMLAEGYEQVGKDFPVFLHPETKDEYALARIERSTGEGYKDFTFHTDGHVTLEEDLSRRDFTINAMAMDENGTIIDPYGGQEDIRTRTLRHVSDAFKEDPLRVLRAARFTAQYPQLTVAPETLAMMQDMVTNDMLDHLTPERVWGELEKALKAKEPSKFIETMDACGALEKILPEIHALHNVPQSPEHHPEGDVFIHNQMVLERAAELTDDPVTRFAALMHDVGKGVTPEELLPQHINHEKNGVPLVKNIAKRLRVPTEYKEAALSTTEHHLRCHRAMEMTAGKVVSLLSAVGAYGNSKGEVKLERFLTACQADAQGRGGADLENYPQADLIQTVYAQTRDIQGQQFIDAGKEPGPHIGEMVTQERIRTAKEVIEAFKEQLPTKKPETVEHGFEY